MSSRPLRLPVAICVDSEKRTLRLLSPPSHRRTVGDKAETIENANPHDNSRIAGQLSDGYGLELLWDSFVREHRHRAEKPRAYPVSPTSHISGHVGRADLIQIAKA